MNGPKRYRRPPQEVEAMGPLTAENRDEMTAWIGSATAEDKRVAGPGRGITPAVLFRTATFVVLVKHGEWLVRVEDKFSACDPDVFAHLYRPVEVAE